jgi:hypothetical protein
MRNTGLVTQSNRYDPSVPWACFPAGEKEGMVNRTNLLELQAIIHESVIISYVHCVIYRNQKALDLYKSEQLENGKYYL